MPGAPERSRPRGLRERVPLAPLTTIGIGGPARWFVEAGTADEVEQALAWAADEALPTFVLGGGSNLLIADEGFPGLVLRVALRGVEEESAGDAVMLCAAAGEPWDALVERAVAASLAGFECLSGIPGCAGATPIQNVGAYGQEVAETVVSVEALSRADGRLCTFAAAECGFAYRDSVFKREERDRWVILAVTFRLQRDAPPALRYAELARHLEAAGGDVDLARVREAVLALRRRKGMVLDPSDEDTRSDGSFFMNPVVPAAALDGVLERVAARGLAPESVPRYPAGEATKLSAAWLIEQAGFRKGHRHGNVGISSKHALALVNRGGGTAREVVELVREIRARVEDAFGVLLVPEPNFVGFVEDPLAPTG
ncbi:MAG TPA: UDP-N-acetylmuramate dehydrogenase [Thermoanaerobaculia bacterium]|jgi:UDP-N-acetylmuramate dehydrogenase|nr:UDP-N-acetylmuramate dehydrogenase [Thermoanaerobaculia bacterium]